MNKDMILGFIRHVLTFGGGYAASQGIMVADEVTTLIGAIMTILGIIWSIIQKKQ